MSYRFLAAAVLLAAALVPGAHAKEMPLEGMAILDEDYCGKGMNTEGCILSFHISGAAAKTLYDGMRAKARQQECTGGLEKLEGGLSCIKDGAADYNCSFGYHFKQREFAGSGEDC